METPQALWATSSSNFYGEGFTLSWWHFFLVFRWTFMFSNLLLLSLVSLFIPCNQICVHIDKIPQILLFFILNSSRSPSLSYEKCFRPLIIFMAFVQFVDFLLNTYNLWEKNNPNKPTFPTSLLLEIKTLTNIFFSPMVGSLFFFF